MATKKKFNLNDDDMVGLISGVAEVKAPEKTVQAASVQNAVSQPAQVQHADMQLADAKPRRTTDPRVAFGISLKGSMKKKIEMCAVVKRTNTSQIVADALSEYFERHPDLIAKYEKMEQLGLLD